MNYNCISENVSERSYLDFETHILSSDGEKHVKTIFLVWVHSNAHVNQTWGPF